MSIPTALATDAANDSGAPVLTMPGRGCRAGAGVDWIGEGWALFRKAPLMWVVLTVILFLIHVALGFVPFLGSIAGYLISPILAGGIVLGCRSLETGGELELEHLFAGFRQRTGSLLVVGALYIVGMVAIVLVFGVFAGFSVVSAFLMGGEEQAIAQLAAVSLPLVLGGLVAAALAVPLMAAYWFAPALVMMHDVPPVEAMKASLGACFRNFIGFLLYGIVMLLLVIVAAIPLGLGLLVWFPVLMASTYASYRAVFTETDGD
ncbi:MAG TPA: BPSS1780 family membrane protein [Usitatibacteraceae bacterium]|jgi:uncharacterized membrane protein|nr:BPSS1780 family membrane protein [Usitatibacteraceae bacterium]